MKRCVVNLIDGKDRRYVLGQNRLIEQMRKQNIPLVYFIGEGSVNAPLHQQEPFAFKIFAIQRARELGYQQILWVDSSVYPVKDIQPVFDRITEHGIFLEDSGHQCDKWLMQESLDYFGITREQAHDIDMISAGFIGFDFERQESITMFANWKLAMEKGMFRGSTIDYRSEQGAASLIAWQLGLHERMSKCHEYFCYVGEQYGTPNPSAPFHLQGF